jgi:hypothetical protein
MAFIKPNPATGELSGVVGDLVFAKQKSGKIIVRKRPVRKAAKRKGEVANQQGFTSAVAYAKKVWAEDPDLQARYNAAAAVQGRQGFHLAKADYLKPPVVREIDLAEYTGCPGEIIRIEAVDNFEVKSVQVKIRNLDESPIEHGQAEREKDRWIYEARSAVPAGKTVVIEITATDYAGRTGARQADHACGPRS